METLEHLAVSVEAHRSLLSRYSTECLADIEATMAIVTTLAYIGEAIALAKAPASTEDELAENLRRGMVMVGLFELTEKHARALLLKSAYSAEEKKDFMDEIDRWKAIVDRHYPNPED